MELFHNHKSVGQPVSISAQMSYAGSTNSAVNPYSPKVSESMRHFVDAMQQMPYEKRELIKRDEYIRHQFEQPISSITSNYLDWVGIIRYGAQLLGFRIGSDFELASLSATNGAAILEKFPDMTVGDIKNAFKVAANGELGKEFKPYGQFSFQYISEILRCYKQKQSERMSSYLNDGKQLTQTQEANNVEQSYKDIGNRIAYLRSQVQDGGEPLLMKDDYTNIYGWLRKNGILGGPNYEVFDQLVAKSGLKDHDKIVLYWKEWFEIEMKHHVEDFLHTPPAMVS